MSINEIETGESGGVADNNNDDVESSLSSSSSDEEEKFVPAKTICRFSC